jgi:hypothetical protein
MNGGPAYRHSIDRSPDRLRRLLKLSGASFPRYLSRRGSPSCLLCLLRARFNVSDTDGDSRSQRLVDVLHAEPLTEEMPFRSGTRRSLTLDRWLWGAREEGVDRRRRVCAKGAQGHVVMLFTRVSILICSNRAHDNPYSTRPNMNRRKMDACRSSHSRHSHIASLPEVSAKNDQRSLSHYSSRYHSIRRQRKHCHDHIAHRHEQMSCSRAGPGAISPRSIRLITSFTRL